MNDVEVAGVFTGACLVVFILVIGVISFVVISSPSLEVNASVVYSDVNIQPSEIGGFVPEVQQIINNLEIVTEEVIKQDKNKTKLVGSSGGGFSNSRIDEPIRLEPKIDLFHPYVIDGNMINLYSIDGNRICFLFDGNIWNKCATDFNTHIAQLPSKLCVVEGDSLSAGYRDYSWTYTIKNYLPFRDCNLEILATSGDTVQQLVNQYQDTNGYYYFLYAGTNDLSSGRDANSIFRDINYLWSIQSGEVVAFTLQPNRSLNADMENQRQLLNQMIIDSNNYDYLVRTDLIFPSVNEYFSYDNLHYNEAGYNLLAQKISEAVQ